MLHRRAVLAAGAAVAGTAVSPKAAATPPEAVVRAVARFVALPVDVASCLVSADGPAPWSLGHRADEVLMVASALKPLTLAAYLKAVEAGRLSLEDERRVDNSVRVPASPVLQDFTGTMSARGLLEAMITHSDNTAADAITAAVGPEAVRQLIAEAGLTATRIPDSIRRLYSRCVGTPDGVDLSWEDLSRHFLRGLPPTGVTLGPPRDARDDIRWWVSSATDLVQWYRDSLAGRHFAEPETLAEYRRILATAAMLPPVVPAGHAAYGKGGNLDWLDLHALGVAGQVETAAGPVTFCFTVNWRGGDRHSMDRFQPVCAHVAETLAAAVAPAR